MSVPARRVRLSSLSMVNRIADARAEQLRLLDVLRTWKGAHPETCSYYVVTLDGQRMDEAMLARVKPVIEAELSARVASFDRDLEALGVDMSRDA